MDDAKKALETAKANAKTTEQMNNSIEFYKTLGLKQDEIDRLMALTTESRTGQGTHNVNDKGTLQANYSGLNELTSINADAFQLNKLEESIQLIKKYNTIRTEIGMEPIAVNIQSMVEAALAANFNEYMWANSFKIDHIATANNNGENIGVNYDSKQDCFETMYYQEKQIYDWQAEGKAALKLELPRDNEDFQYKHNGEVITRTEYNTLLRNYVAEKFKEKNGREMNSNDYQTGHYTNYIDPDFKSVGIAVSGTPYDISSKNDHDNPNYVDYGLYGTYYTTSIRFSGGSEAQPDRWNPGHKNLIMSVEDFEKAFTEYKNKVDNLGQAVADAQRAFDMANSKLKFMQERSLPGLNNTIANADKKIGEVTDAISGLEAEVAKLDVTKKEAEAKANEAQKVVDAHAQTVADKEQEVKNAEADVTKANDAKNDADKAVSNAEKDLETAKAGVKSANDELAKAQTRLEELKALLEGGTSEAYETAKAEFAKAKDAKDAADAKLAEAEQAKAEADKALAEANDARGKAQKAYDAVAEELKSAKSDLEAKQEALDKATEKAEEADAELADAQAKAEEIVKAQEAADKAKIDLEKAQKAYDSAKENSSAAQIVLSSKQDALKKANEAVAVAKDALDGANETVSKLTDDYNAIKGEHEKAMSEKDKLTKAMLSAQAKKEAYEKAISDRDTLTKEVEELTVALKQASKDVTTNSTFVGAAKMQLDSAKKDYEVDLENYTIINKKAEAEKAAAEKKKTEELKAQQATAQTGIDLGLAPTMAAFAGSLSTAAYILVKKKRRENK